MKNNHNKLSIDITKKINKKTKKEEGIFFTPNNIIKLNLDLLLKYFNNINTILEPSCGSCSYITEINKRYNGKNILGIENNETIYNSIKHLNEGSTKIIKENFLNYENNNKFDLIIGNPPYFVMKKNKISGDYYEYFDGRPNIFILFIIKSLKLLNENGILSFVIPKNFLNCQYYNKTRKYIFENYLIIDIIDCDDGFIETKQKTIILIVQNKTDLRKKDINNNFSFLKNQFLIFGSKKSIIEIKKLYQNSKSLYELGFDVKVGNVIWNENKDIITNDKNKTRLIYNGDILNNKLIMKSYKNQFKKNFINKTGIKGAILLINRGYGVGNYKFEYCLIEDNNMEYLIENHLIYIKSLNKNNNVLSDLKKIINSLLNEKTKRFIELFCSNNALNTTEMKYLLPIFNWI